MAIDTTTLEYSPKPITSLFGGHLLAACAYRLGSVTVVELTFIDSTISFIKVGPSGLEIGGTNEMGTGTKVAW